MARVRKTDRFLGQLLDSLRSYLPGEWILEQHPNWRLRQRQDWGHIGIGPSMTYKYLPNTSVFLTFGVSHDILVPTLRQLKEAAGFEYRDGYQVMQTTENYPPRPEHWVVRVDDYNEVAVPQAVDQLMGGGRAKRLLDLLQRFKRLESIRDAIETNDGTILSYGVAEVVVAIDLVLNDLKHLKIYRDTCKPPQFQRQVEDALQTLGITL